MELVTSENVYGWMMDRIQVEITNSDLELPEVYFEEHGRHEAESVEKFVERFEKDNF